MSLTGDLSQTLLTDLIDFYCMKRETVCVAVNGESGEGGVLFIESGAVVDARLGELVGEGAVREALLLREGDYRVERDVRCQQRTIFEPWKKLVLEAARLTDEAHREESHVTSVGTTKRCTVCGRDFHEGLTCPHDGSILVAVTRPPPRPNAEVMTPGTVARHLPTPQALRAATGSSHPAAHKSSPMMAAPPTAPVTVPIHPAETSPLSPALEGSPSGRKAITIGMLAVLITLAAILVAISQRKDPQAAAPAAKVSAVVHAPEPERIVNGVTDTEIIFGMSAPFSGSAKELGRGMKTGFELAFAAANEQGGVFGRRLRLVALDDGYEPARTKETMRELIEHKKVFGIVGNVGTPTSAVAVPYALDKKVLFYGAFTGAGLLRKDPPDRYVFNYRSSYAEETASVVRYLIEQKRIKPEQIAVFAQEDGYGDAGFTGVANELRRRYRRDPGAIVRIGYKRNTIDVQAAVDKVVENPEIRAVVMVPTYRAAARFVEKVKEKRPEMVFTSVSFVGSSALAEEFQQLNPRVGEGVIVTQVVPLPNSRSSVTLRYQELLAKHAPGERPDFVSLEGYLAGNLLIEALRKQGKNVDTESLIATMENLRGLDLGIGAALGFGLSEHQASHKVWGTVLDGAGQYQPVELE